MQLTEEFGHARRCGVPLLAIATPDPMATMKSVASAACNGQPTPIVCWDLVRGTLPWNEAGEQVAAMTGEGDADESVGDPNGLLLKAVEFPARTIVFLLGAPAFFDNPMFTQGVWNLREEYKRDFRTLILLGHAITLPPALANDVVVLDEELPRPDELAAIVRKLDDAASLCPKCRGDGTDAGLECERCSGTGESPRPKLDDDGVSRATEAVQGLAAFPAEQAVAMSLRKDGLDMGHLWERKRQMIEQAPGLSVWRGGERFADVGGLAHIKDKLGRLFAGNEPPNAIVFVDEIEKMLAGSSGEMSDTSGVSQGILQAVLTHMQDHESSGMIFVGPPGAGKSLIAKCAGNEASIPTVALDAGAMKGSLVGQSEGNVRTALKVVSAVSNDRALWIATCNAIASLPPELRRRFAFGTYFFDLPDADERRAIWKHYRHQYAVSAKQVAKMPDDTDWTGSEIKTCCLLAYRMKCTLREAAECIVPVAQSAASVIERLRDEASGRYISASRPGPYRRAKSGDGGKGRAMSLDN